MRRTKSQIKLLKLNQTKDTGRAVFMVGAVILMLVIGRLLTYRVSASADEPMKFTIIGRFGVLAEGDISDGTPAAFMKFLDRLKSDRSNADVYHQLVFNSGGGDLAAGLDLGREIRRARWSTVVATAVNYFPRKWRWNPGECDSACTFAFLGGVERDVQSDSKFGVHRFWGKDSGDVQQDTQQVAGLLVDYIREMGVSSEMYTLMTQGSPDKVKYLDNATLKRLNVITTHGVTATLLDQHGAPVLRLAQESFGQSNTMDFYCSGPRLVARIDLDSDELREYGADFTLEWGSFPIPKGAYKLAPGANGKIGIEVYVSRAVLNDYLLKTNIVELMIGRSTDDALSRLASRHPVPTQFGDFDKPIPPMFHTALRAQADSCH